MEPGTSAIVAIAEDRVIERLERGIAGYQRIAKHTVSAEAAMAITAVAEDDDSGEGQPAEQKDEAEKPTP
jgi:hypothetical protein